MTIMATQKKIEDVQDIYFLDLLSQHPNLYITSHVHYGNVMMRRGSWGQIAISLSITPKQAEENWKRLYEFYIEEKTLRECENNCNIALEAGVESCQHTTIYEKLLSMLHSPLKNATPQCDQKHLRIPCAITQVKKKATIKKTTEVTTKAEENFTVKSTSNSKIGELVAAELLLRSPNSRKEIRKELHKCLLGHTDK